MAGLRPSARDALIFTLLDVVISLSRPSDYTEREGARFLVKFKKARGIHGTDMDDIAAKLTTDAIGAQ